MSCPHISEIRSPTEHHEVQKEECTKCFHSDVSGTGLDVCLTCFNGGCPSKHGPQHSTLAKHPVVLNIRRVALEAKAPEVQAQEVTTLGIGNEGGFAGSMRIEYDTTCTVTCTACDLELDQTDATVGGAVAAVLAAKVGTEIADVAEPWVFKPVSCDHINTLQQENVQQISDTKELVKCNDCDVAEGLWLCLTCGNLGCGRKNYDGSGGNGHAVAHHQSAGHVVVLKAGTITPQGDASIFCYGCDEDRKDDHLAEHLSAFGIDLAGQEKWALTTEEVNIQANKDALRWSRMLEKGSQQTLAFGPGFTGLDNLGNSCYMASVLQVLFALPSYREVYFTKGQQHLEACRSNRPASCFQCQMAKLGHGLLSGEYSKTPSKEVLAELNKQISSAETSQADTDEQETSKKLLIANVQPGIAPGMFKKLVTKNHEAFKSKRQQDAVEYLQFLNEYIRKQEQKSGNDPTSTFDFVLESKLQCTECKCVRYSEQEDSSIALSIPKVKKPVKMDTATDGETKEEEEEENDKTYEDVSMVTMLKSWTTPEVLADYKCARCDKRTVAHKTLKFKTFPDTLVVRAVRFVQESMMSFEPVKLNVYINDSDAQFDVNTYNLRATGQQDGEELFPEAAPPAPKVADRAIVDACKQMGFGENACTRAALAVDNANAEAAVNWLMQHMGDADLNDPVTSGAPSATAAVNEDAVNNFIGMGFPRDRAVYALQQANGDANGAMEWIFANPDTPLTAPVTENDAKSSTAIDSTATNYALKAVITHLGSSTKSGHYVAYVHKNGKWGYFNDNKVSEQDKPLLGKGYLFVYEKLK